MKLIFPPYFHSRRRVVLLAATLILPAAASEAAWIPLANTNSQGIGTMLLLSDGTVMAQGAGTTASWFRLTPANGSYVNGTWSTLPSMHYTRLYCASAILQDGRVFFAGGEYGTGTTNSEIYDPVANTWTVIPVPSGIINTNNSLTAQGANTGGFSDSGSVILNNGKVLIAPVNPADGISTAIYDPFLNTFSTGPVPQYQDEASWVKLPDDSILTADPNNFNSERYLPSQNIWSNDGTVPVSLFGAGSEEGPGILLPDGRALFLGGTTSTALYTPSGGAGSGVWTQGPAFPNSQAMPDAAAAMMVNGKVLCAVSPVGIGTNVFTSPTSFYEYDYTAGPVGSFTRTNAPTGGLTLNTPTYLTRMLVLPDGNVLFTYGSSQLYIYQPSTGPIAAGKPAISSITWNADGSLHLTGTLFNGISQGAAYGDDAQMDSNFPIVRLTDGGGNVTYGRTYNWSSTSVATGSQTVSSECTFNWAALSQGPYSLVVVANGISSDPVTFYGPVWVNFNFGGLIHLGTYAFPFNTMAAATNAVLSGGTVVIAGTGSSAETLTISKPMSIHSVNGINTIGP